MTTPWFFLAPFLLFRSFSRNTSLASSQCCLLALTVDCWSEISWNLPLFLLNRSINTQLQRPFPSDCLLDVQRDAMAAEAILEVAVYMHRFHNLDLFQQGWYQVKVTSKWEGSDDLPGVPSRVVQYEAPDGVDDAGSIWQINDADHSFCTRPFRIKYARQDVFLAVMVSFNLSLRAVERLLLNAVTIQFELLFAPPDLTKPSSISSLEYSACSKHDFRIPPRAMLGLHSYCPLHFDTWHMVLIDVTVHSVLLKVNSNSFKPEELGREGSPIVDDSSLTAAGEGSQAINSSAVDPRDIALWKALHTSRDILRHELDVFVTSIHQQVPFQTIENNAVATIAKQLNLTSTENGGNNSGDRKRHPKNQKWSQEVADSLKLNQSGGNNQLATSFSFTKLELVEAFQALGSELSLLWNTFLKFHRSNRSLLWEYLRGAWVDERSTEWSLWITHCKMDLQLNGANQEYGLSPGMQLSNKQPSKKITEEASVVSASRAELHRKTLEQINMDSHTLQDMHVFASPSHLPIIYVESHTVPCEPVGSDPTLSNKNMGSELRLLENPGSLLTMSSKSRGKVLRVVVFVHGFQGHHLDLRLVRNQWLLIDPTAECLMSEINEDRTTSDFRELGHRLAEEVATFMKTKFGSFLRKASLGHCRLSFVGHSMGNIIIRAALADPLMRPYLQFLYTFLSISGPHLGYLYSSNTLFNSGLWLLKKLKASPCMHQLTFTDGASIQDCFLFKLSEERTFEHFQNVILLSSPQDRYVPYHSARIEMCQAAIRDSRKGPTYSTMHQNCMEQILRASAVDRAFLRCDVNFNTSAQARSLNNLIGRTAHIEFLETDAFLKFLMWTFPKFFS